ncbi:MAG: hypothetical protein JMN25_17350 [gamma proteobacterium endosymbiont of Lamellibrachia anaximandri]|nr:hypothetical protein [gamma proteobacterium endosymbiont of Lamellibrachia anaximandri]
MRPSTIKPGTPLNIAPLFGGGQSLTAVFIKRTPARGRFMAINYLRFPAYAGIHGPDDDGTIQMSDVDLSNHGHIANSQ